MGNWVIFIVNSKGESTIMRTRGVYKSVNERLVKILVIKQYKGFMVVP